MDYKAERKKTRHIAIDQTIVRDIINAPSSTLFSLKLLHLPVSLSSSEMFSLSKMNKSHVLLPQIRAFSFQQLPNTPFLLALILMLLDIPASSELGKKEK